MFDVQLSKLKNVYKLPAERKLISKTYIAFDLPQPCGTKEQNILSYQFIYIYGDLKI